MLHRRLPVWSTCLFALCGLGLTLARADVTLYVSPAGNDEWTGRAALHAGTDGPFATPAPAARAVRELRSANAGKLPGPVTVELGGGTYALAETWVITADDSGTPQAPVSWRARAGEHVVLSGGDRLATWRPGELNGKAVWVATGPGHPFRSLWVAGQSRTRARHPNRGTLVIPKAPQPHGNWENGQDHFRYAEGDVPRFTFADADVLTFSRWVESRLPVMLVNPKTGAMKFSRSSVFNTDAGDVFHIENAPEFLDEPGEWYSPLSGKEVYYLPKDGEKIDSTEAIAPRLAQLVRFGGDSAQGRFVEHLTFTGIEFAHCEVTLPEIPPNAPGLPPRGGYVQAAYAVPALVSATGARHVTFQSCTFAHTGTYGLELGQGCQDNRVVNCTLTDLGAGGIKIGDPAQRKEPAEQTRGNVVSDCEIGPFGKLFQSGNGVWIGQSFDNVITHNHIHDGYSTGVSVGWTWGYEASLAHGNVIEYNHIHHLGQPAGEDKPLLSDLGGLYTLGTQPGTVIRFNQFHDISGRKYGGWGIYFDEGTSQVVAENNLVFRTTHGAFHQHYGRDNVVRNNIFAYGRDNQIQRTRSEDHNSFTFERNLVLWDHGPAVVGAWDKNNAVFSKNQYWHVGEGKDSFAGKPFEEWKKGGLDADSVVADPGFSNPAQGDFHFKPGAGPAASVGFIPWDLNDIGPRKPAASK